MNNGRIAFIWMVNTPERLIGINATLFFMNQSKYKDIIDIWIAASTVELERQVRQITDASPYQDLHIRSLSVNDTSWHGYKKKLASIIRDYEYFIKCDDDLFYSHHTIDYLIEQRTLLDSGEVTWLFPVSSINSLTTDTFIEDFVQDESVKQQIYAEFTKFDYRNYPEHNGTDHLGPLKEFCINHMPTWNATAFREYMWKSMYFNGGEHPIRHCNPAIVLLNQYIIDNIDRVFSVGDFRTEQVPGFYQAQIYLMKSSVWFTVQQLVSEGLIPRGLIDETEINWYVKYHKKKAVVVHNAFVIHPALQGVNLNYYHNMIYQKIHQFIGA